MGATDGVSTLRGALISTMGHIDILLHNAVRSTFHGNDEATRYVTNPLLENQGPLADRLTKARLLVALGRVDSTVFEDLETLCKLHDLVVYTPGELNYRSPEVLHLLGELNYLDNNLILLFNQRLTQVPSEPSLREPYLKTLENSIRSAMTLAVESIEQAISRSPGSITG